jgi:hypothetical protein
VKDFEKPYSNKPSEVQSVMKLMLDDFEKLYLDSIKTLPKVSKNYTKIL